jgi:hypothetical protein
MTARGALQQEQPALRRLLEVIGDGALKVQPPLRGTDTSRSDEFGQWTPGARQFLVRSTRNVISHYRRVLARDRLSEAERNRIHDRIRQEEDVLLRLLGENDNQKSSGPGFQYSFLNHRALEFGEHETLGGRRRSDQKAA